MYCFYYKVILSISNGNVDRWSLLQSIFFIFCQTFIFCIILTVFSIKEFGRRYIYLFDLPVAIVGVDCRLHLEHSEECLWVPFIVTDDHDLRIQFNLI